jgi:hypothetical protein
MILWMIFLAAAAGMKADEFEIKPLEGMKGYNRIARFGWY